MAEPRGPLDLAATLRAVGDEPGPPPVLEAVFFHRTLARWLGLDEGKVDGVADPVQWQYGYWRADLVRETAHDVDDRQAFAAVLAAAEDDAGETVRWWVKKDGRGRIVDAGWISDPPRLLDDALPYTPPALDDVALGRLFGDDE